MAFVQVTLATILLNACYAFADGIDFSSYTNDELRSLIADARNELTKREEHNYYQ